MHGMPCNVHGFPALFLGIVTDDNDNVRVVYTSLDQPCMYLNMTHPSHVQFVSVVPAPEPAPVKTGPDLGDKIRLIKLLREAVAVANEENNTEDSGAPRLSLTTAKKMAEKFLEGR